MNIPLLDMRRQNLPLAEELSETFRRVLHSGRYIGGREVEDFERTAAAVCGARFDIGMSSGTDAILGALMALGIGPRDEVICSSFTFFATAGRIALVGARPVFADSCLDTFNHTIESLITPNTCAIIPVNLYVQPADMDTILEIARRHHLAAIEDAAQSFGAEYCGKPVGSLGEFGIFSFFRSKNLGGLGDSGLLVTNDLALTETARLLRDPHLSEYTADRQRNACEFALEGPRGGGVVDVLPSVSGPDRTHIANQYTLCIRRAAGWQWAASPRDSLRRWLEKRGIASEISYPNPLHQQECFRPYGPYRKLPVCEALADELVSLPVFAELTGTEVDTVSNGISDFIYSSSQLPPGQRCQSGVIA